MQDSYIGISQNRLNHILGVARKCYIISKRHGFSENFCRKMFMVGWCHDVGYEFSKEQSSHPDVSVQMVSLLLGCDCDKSNIFTAIKEHGKYQTCQPHNIEWKILNIADLTVNNVGNNVSVYDRLKDIANKYGEASNQYLTACDIAYEVGLTKENLNKFQ